MFVCGSWLASVPVLMVMLRLVVNLEEKKEAECFLKKYVAVFS